MDAVTIFRQVQALNQKERIKLIQKIWATYAQDIEDLTWLAFSVIPDNATVEEQPYVGER